MIIYKYFMNIKFININFMDIYLHVYMCILYLHIHIHAFVCVCAPNDKNSAHYKVMISYSDI